MEINSPPNIAIVIEDVTQYTFPSGEAELTEELREFVRNELVDKIEENVEKFDISVVEVIGHTDGQVFGLSYGNLDDMLERVVNGTASIEELQASSNLGLGMVRALSVVRELQKIQREEGRLQKLDSKKGFRAYSAAQLTLTSGELSQPNSEPDASRRRIEIRFIRSRPGKTYR